MARYDYEARDQGGKPVKGVVEAPTEDIARETLQEKGLLVVSMTAAQKAGLLAFELPFFNKIPVKDLVVFSRQFAVLMGSKVPVVRALKTVAAQTKNPRLQVILTDMSADVESGTALSVSMAEHPTAFSSFFVNMIRAGETTGKLEETMNYLADQMERDYDLESKIRGAMIYPAFVIFGLVVVGFIMMAFVVPKLTGVLAESGVELPITTKILIATSGFFQKYAVLIVIAAVVGAGLFRYWTGRSTGRQIWDRAKLYLPVFGPLLRNIYLIRFTRSFGTLVNGGVDVPASLVICADVVGNAHYEEVIRATLKEVNDGNSLTSVMAGDRLVPQMIPQMISVGEETGRLSEVLEKLTDFYSRELENSVANLVSAIEPLIMLVMGGAVGVMVSAIILPMYKLATQF
jgi:type IV pilus assembly protein PilC